jgi:N-acyl amino acid synthase of PEP-CTERM/exosortase system
MVEAKNSLGFFQQCFSIRCATTTEDRQKVHRIRYRVYCEEFGYETSGNFPNQMECDSFDDISTHCLVTHIASGMAAGCARICPASVNGADHDLPLDRCCRQTVYAEEMARIVVSRKHICEASRFAVDGAFRRRSGEGLTRFGEIASLNLSDAEQRSFPRISVTLMMAAAAMANLLDRPYVFSVMEPFLPRLLNRSGLVFRRMGRDVHYHGIRAVYFADARDYVQELDQDFLTLYTWVQDELRASLPQGVLPVC